MAPSMIIYYPKQPLFSKPCSRWPYQEIAAKLSSQEHTRPPRIQEENFDFSSRYQTFGHDLISGKLRNHHLTSKKLRGRPPAWLPNPPLEGKIKKIPFCCSE